MKFLILLFIVALVYATGDKCPKLATGVKTTDTPCKNNNKCSVACGKYSQNKCQGFADVVVLDTKLYNTVCPFEGSRLVRARSFVSKTLQSKNKDAIATEIVSQLAFWTGLQDYAKTFSKASDRLAAEKNLVKDLNAQYKAYEVKRATGASLKAILANKVSATEYNTKIGKLVNSIVVVALSRKCLCNAFLRAQYKVSAPQSERDIQWAQGTVVFQNMMESCKKIPAATELCKKYKVSGKDLSCAVLANEKGCLPIYEKLYEETLKPLAPKLPTGQAKGPIVRESPIVEPQWLKNIQLEQAKENPVKVQVPINKQPIIVEAPKKPTNPEPTKPVEPVKAPVQPPVQAPVQTPTKPVQTPVEAPKVNSPPPTVPKPSDPKPVEPPKPKIAPLIVPKVPKKAKPVVPTTTQLNSTPTAPKTPAPVAPTVPAAPKPKEAPKVPVGPSQFVGQKKKINIFNQQ
jgi:hypothetical protein